MSNATFKKSEYSYELNITKNIAVLRTTISCADLVKLNVNKSTNLRDASVAQKKTRELIDSLSEHPEVFLFNSESIVINVKSVFYNDDESITVEFPTNNSDVYGLINGGHRLCAMEFLASAGALSEEAKVHLEILCGAGVTKEYLHQLAINRNNNMSLSRSDRANQEGKYDTLKKLLKDHPCYDYTQFRTGASNYQALTPRALMSIAYCFSDQQIEYSPDGFPVSTGDFIHSRFNTTSRFIQTFFDEKKSEILSNKRYFYDILDIVNMIDRVSVKVATDHPNTRLDLSKNMRYPLIYTGEDDWDLARRVSAQKLWPLIAATTLLTFKKSDCVYYSFQCMALDFFTEDMVYQYIENFISNRKAFRSKDYKRDHSKWLSSAFSSENMILAASEELQKLYKNFVNAKKKEKSA